MEAYLLILKTNGDQHITKLRPIKYRQPDTHDGHQP